MIRAATIIGVVAFAALAITWTQAAPDNQDDLVSGDDWRVTQNTERITALEGRVDKLESVSQTPSGQQSTAPIVYQYPPMQTYYGGSAGTPISSGGSAGYTMEMPSYATSYAAAAMPQRPSRTGPLRRLFSGARSGGGTCQIVNGQMICN